MNAKNMTLREIYSSLFNELLPLIQEGSEGSYAVALTKVEVFFTNLGFKLTTLQVMGFVNKLWDNYYKNLEENSDEQRRN